MMSVRRKMLGALLSVVLVLGLMPTAAFAAIGDVPAGESAIGQVHVVIEDAVGRPAGKGYPEPKGTIAEGWVDLYPSDSMMSAVARLAKRGSVAIEGAESGYITSIDGLEAFDCGQMSGWMGTLNDWFTNTGFDDVRVASGDLGAGDEIRVMYTLDYGDDLGGSWSNNDKTVKGLAVSAGALAPSFSSGVHAYTLSVPKGTKSVAITPTAANKNFQVRASVGATEYKRTERIPVSNGTTILVICGDPSWPTMNSASGAADVPAEKYVINVKVDESLPVPAFPDVDYSSWYGDAVTFVAGKGLITGYSDTGTFGVGDVLTRAQLVTILWRNACPGEYAEYDPATAKDTTGIAGSADGTYYTAAANWAVENGVITGFVRPDGSRDFAAGDPVTFEQLITILARIGADEGDVAAAGGDLSAFEDGSSADAWAAPALAWAAQEGLVTGYDEPLGKYLRPLEGVARERVAVVLMRAFDLGILE